MKYTVTIRHSADCRLCNTTIGGSTEKRMYLWMLLHLVYRHGKFGLLYHLPYYLWWQPKKLQPRGTKI